MAEVSLFSNEYFTIKLNKYDEAQKSKLGELIFELNQENIQALVESQFPKDSFIIVNVPSSFGANSRPGQGGSVSASLRGFSVNQKMCDGCRKVPATIDVGDDVFYCDACSDKSDHPSVTSCPKCGKSISWTVSNTYSLSGACECTVWKTENIAEKTAVLESSVKKTVKTV